MNIYTAEVLEKINNGPGRWNYLRVGVFRGEGDKREQVGEYIRNYSSLYSTFYAFKQNGREYALYSPHYTATRLMELPSCRDLGGEEPGGGGFCPVDFYVPSFVIREIINEHKPARQIRINKPTPNDLLPRSYETKTRIEATAEWVPTIERSYPVGVEQFYPFGFVAGCVWGDDSSWKIEYLDLSEAHRGILRRDARFGYIALPEKLSLKEAVGLADYAMTDFADGEDEDWLHHITIAVMRRFDLRTGELAKGYENG